MQGACFSFGTKAETLVRLTGRIASAKILPCCFFTAQQWRDDRRAVLDRLAQQPWSREPMVVRSSAQGEDLEGTSLAGAHDSVLNVTRDELPAAVEQVLASYQRRRECSPQDQVLVQPMLRDVAVSGVAFTSCPTTGAPYIIINYEDRGDTTAVTSGSDGTKVLVHAKSSPAARNSPVAPVIALAHELEEISQHQRLDIEFAIDTAGTLYLFQLRRLPPLSRPAMDATEQRRALSLIAGKVSSINRPHPYLCGSRTVFGVMPDWNPAEIIGVRPRPLALRLYRELVTDAIWAYQRNNYGYRNLRSFPLLVSFHGLPYVDVRVSFNSFIPADVSERLASKLVDYYIDRLIEAPAFHDKVEFEIVHSCYAFDLPERLQRLAAHGFDASEIKTILESLRTLTNRVVNNQTGLWRSEMQRVEELDRRRVAVLGSGLDLASKVYWLLEDCKRYGTLPFAGLARAGFIAMQMLNSLVTIGLITADEKRRFMSGVDSISTTMGRDMEQSSRDGFLEKYGHLRPGTYDILSFRYDEAADLYFQWPPTSRGERHENLAAFSLSLSQLRQVDKLLQSHGLEHDMIGLFDFIEAGIRGREYSKFVFTRSLSDALSLLVELGKEHGFSREEMSFLDIRTIYEIHSSSGDVRSQLAESIARGQASHAITEQLQLPSLIVSEADVWSFQHLSTQPNFMASRRVIAPVRRVKDAADNELAGCIVCIRSADPGFDWIFSRGIAGLITAYGGANSHMAIRAEELRVPAAIGVGEQAFDKYASADRLELDPLNRHIRIIS